jgi:NTE family protein
MAATDGDKNQPPHHEQVALLLQGGGALGSYHHGIYEALSEAGYRFDWFAGTSIGGIQAAIIAGNPPGQRLAQLETFWQRISRPQYAPAPPATHPLRKSVNLMDAMTTMCFGQPGFFQPDPMASLPWPWNPGKRPAYYDLQPLRETLEELIDFERINRGEQRLSLGAVEVETGRHVYFDSRDQTIDVRHVMASGALPPAFPAVAIDGMTYWDGGLLSNTPLDVVFDDRPRRSTLCFMVDLFDPNGQTPGDMDEIEDRRKDIIYASRSHMQIQDQSKLHNLRQAVSRLYSELPDDKQRDPEIQALAGLGCTTTMNLVHFVYGGQAYRSWAKDFTFLPQTIADHHRRGYKDASLALRDRPWEDPVPPGTGISHHEVTAGVTDHY